MSTWVYLEKQNQANLTFFSPLYSCPLALLCLTLDSSYRGAGGCECWPSERRESCGSSTDCALFYFTLILDLIILECIKPSLSHLDHLCLGNGVSDEVFSLRRDCGFSFKKYVSEG